jgi:hypothetical protein
MKLRYALVQGGTMIAPFLRQPLCQPLSGVARVVVSGPGASAHLSRVRISFEAICGTPDQLVDDYRNKLWQAVQAAAAGPPAAHIASQQLLDQLGIYGPADSSKLYAGTGTPRIEPINPDGKICRELLEDLCTIAGIPVRQLAESLTAYADWRNGTPSLGRSRPIP